MKLLLILTASAILCLTICSCVALAPFRSKSPVTRVTFNKWDKAWKLANPSCELIVVPQVSRIMSFSLASQTNLLWLNNAFAGKVIPANNGRWNNMGGDKLWPTEQNLWKKYTGRGWPPPYHYDSAVCTGQKIPDGVKTISPRDPDFGAVSIREITIHPLKPIIAIKQRYEKSEGKPVPMTIWNITQVKRPSYCILPLSAGKKADRFKKFGAVIDANCKEQKTVVSIFNHDKEHQKIGIRARDSLSDNWLAAIYKEHGLMFIQSHDLQEGQTYPDDDCHAEIYLAPGPSGYVELELLSPLTTMDIGSKLQHDIVWQLIEIDEATVADPEKAAAAARKAVAELNHRNAQ